MKKGNSLLAAAILAIGLNPAGLSAAEEIRLTAVSGFPPVISIVSEFQKTFIPSVEQKLAADGRYEINWTEGFSGTIAKPGGELESVQQGIADFGIVPTVFHADKLPFYNLSYVTPFVTTDLPLVVRTYDDLIQQYPAVGEYWQRYGQVQLASAGFVDDYVIVTDQPVKSLEDVQGLKIGAAGSNVRWLSSLGAVGVVANLNTYYNEVNNGVYDGAFMWAEAVADLKMVDVAQNMLRAQTGAQTSFSLTVNSRVWNKLPPFVQEVLSETAIEFRDHLAAQVMQENSQDFASYEQGGGTIVDLPEAERKVWSQQLPDLAGEWVEAMDRAGLPGQDILVSYMEVMKQADQNIARDWSE